MKFDHILKAVQLNHSQKSPPIVKDLGTNGGHNSITNIQPSENFESECSGRKHAALSTKVVKGSSSPLVLNFSDQLNTGAVDSARQMLPSEPSQRQTTDDQLVKTKDKTSKESALPKGRATLFQRLQKMNPFGGDAVDKGKPRWSFSSSPTKHNKVTPVLPTERGKQLWAKTRNVFRAINSWKRVRSDVLLYGTHNYEFRKTFNVLTQHRVNNLTMREQHRKHRERAVTPLNLNSIQKWRRQSAAQSLRSKIPFQNSSRDDDVKRRSCLDFKGRGGVYFHPESRFKQSWSFLIIVFLMYVAFLMPYSLAFLNDQYDSFASLEINTPRTGNTN